MQRAVEILFAQIFGTSAVLATCAAVWYLLVGDAVSCVISALVASISSTWFQFKLRRI